MGGRIGLLSVTVFLGCASGRVPPSDVSDRTDRGGEDAGEVTGADPSPLVGGCGPADDDLVPKYTLPFPAGDAYPLTQGNCGAASHDGRFAFSFDFRMPVGTPVVAARDGVVFALREGRPNGTRRIGDENYVFVRHEDGEISRYIHITTDGVLVERGERVARGDTIALSGNSGRSAFPHLHFDVARGCGAERCVTVPSAFLNASPPIPLELGEIRAVEPRGSVRWVTQSTAFVVTSSF